MIVEDENGVETYLEPDGGYVKEEPDCPGCCDSGYRGRRRCPDCNPSWWQHQAFVWKWRLHVLVAWWPRDWWPRRRPAPGARAAFDDQAPF